jgi:hypothetical protein
VKLDDRTLANIEVALEEVFRNRPHGGDHDSRKQVARKLLQSAKRGNTTLGGLTSLAKLARNDLSPREAS